MTQEFKLNIFVFLGPSLSLDVAKKILPQAHYLPPIRCGDILRVLRLKPSIIAIIDGYFENTPAVWHKEILYALKKGVVVIGGSSMGALRGSELNVFGMQTEGSIAQDYLSEIINDDDEVALLHSPLPENYSATSDPMVNIRATLKKAVTQDIIHKTIETLLVNITKNLFYPERTLDKIIQLGYQEGIDAPQLNRLKQWLSENNLVNLKKHDAIAVLSTIAEKKVTAQIKNNFPFSHSAFFSALYKYVMCRPLNFDGNYLPDDEKIASISRYLGHDYIMCRHLAYLLAACYALSENEQGKKDSHIDENFLTSTEDYVRFLLYLSGDYFKYRQCFNKLPEDISACQGLVYQKFESENPVRFHLYLEMASCWHIVEKKILSLKLTPRISSIQQYSEKFQLKINKKNIKKWMSDNDTNPIEHQFMLEALHRLDFFILQNNLSCLNIVEKQTEINWFSQALSRSGLYGDAKALYEDKQKLVNLIKMQSKTQKDLNYYAQSLDFKDVRDFLQPVSSDFTDVNSVITD